MLILKNNFLNSWQDLNRGYFASEANALSTALLKPAIRIKQI
jgi:hypothetical protein